jgi:hypothetical protein
MGRIGMEKMDGTHRRVAMGSARSASLRRACSRAERGSSESKGVRQGRGASTNSPVRRWMDRERVRAGWAGREMDSGIPTRATEVPACEKQEEAQGRLVEIIFK